MSQRVLPPSGLGLDVARWERACRCAHSLVERDIVPAIAFQVVRPAGVTVPVCCGRLRPSDAPGQMLRDDAIFLTASLSKPLVALAALALVESGRLSLQDRVVDFIPEFDSAPKRPVTVRHLLTHTSGLPDMLPNNRALRQSQAGLAAFVTGACAVTLDYPCGRGMQYQSMGFALLGEIITRVSGTSCADYLRETLFEPLGMPDTALGAPDDWFTGTEPRVARIAEVRVPDEQRGGDDWNWNSPYWRKLGAPWGGVFSTVADLGRCLQMLLCHGVTERGQLFSAATIAAATTNQLEPLHDLPESDRRTRGWGYGWRLNWTGHAATFGDFLPGSTYGHWGATGTLWWVDPVREIGLVLLTTQPLARDDTTLLRLSNAIASAVIE